MKSERYPLEKSSWFVVNRATGVYEEYGFRSKALALTDVSFLNARERAAGRDGQFGVSPSPPRPPPELKLLKGGRA